MRPFVSVLLWLVTVNLSVAEEVVIYTSLDQVFSEPVLQAFEKETGIRVKAVYDVEASKTTGLVNRLIAERPNPRADVFWNSEVGRTLVLKDKGVLTPYVSPSAADIPDQFKDAEGYWTGFGARARVLIYNKDLVPEDRLPVSIFDLTDPVRQVIFVEDFFQSRRHSLDIAPGHTAVRGKALDYDQQF